MLKKSKSSGKPQALRIAIGLATRLPWAAMPIRLLACLLLAAVATAAPEWPEPDRDARPILRLDWPDAPPEHAAIGASLEALAERDFGGVELRPADAVDSLLWPGPAWVAASAHAAREAERLGLRLELACHAGRHPLSFEHPALRLIPVRADSDGGTTRVPLPPGELVCLAAWPPEGEPVDLLPFAEPGATELAWEAPRGRWEIYGLATRPFAAPNEPRRGEGDEEPPRAIVPSPLDPLSPTARLLWLDELERSFIDYDAPFPHARTLTVGSLPGARWSRGLLPAFERLRSYDLLEQLPALFGEADAGTCDRVQCDFRQTIADLHFESLLAWHRWSNGQGSLSRLELDAPQGHPLDLHAIADLPGARVGAEHRDEVLLGLPASAARLSTKPYAGARIAPAATLAELEARVQRAWLAGLNQSSFPREAETAPDAFFAAVSRVQALLQSGAPDPDVLLYLPIHDFWSDRGGLPDEPRARSEFLLGSGYHRCARAFLRHGIAFDSVSDRFLERATVIGDRIVVGGLTYRTLVLPELQRLPETTAQRILELVERGARVAVLGGWPEDVPGFPLPDIRRGTLFRALQQLNPERVAEDEHPLALVSRHGARPEPMAEHGLRFVRRAHETGHQYFIANPGPETVDAWVPLARDAAAAWLLDPRDPSRRGRVAAREVDGETRFRLRLAPGEWRLLWTREEADEDEAEPWLDPTDEARSLAGDWELLLPGREPLRTELLGDWRSHPDPALAEFGGSVRYRLEFEHEGDGPQLLDLGEVAGHSVVRLNGEALGSSFGHPQRLEASRLLEPGTNLLEIEIAREHPSLPGGLLGPVRLVPLAPTPAEEPEAEEPEPEPEPPSTDDPETETPPSDEEPP